MNATTYDFKPCPFCGKTAIKVVDKILECRMGHDAPCSKLKQVQAECTNCGARGPRRTIEAVYTSEAEAASCVAWNERKG